MLNTIVPKYLLDCVNNSKFDIVYLLYNFIEYIELGDNYTRGIKLYHKTNYSEKHTPYVIVLQHL